MNDGDFSIPNQPRAVTLPAHVTPSHKALPVTQPSSPNLVTLIQNSVCLRKIEKMSSNFPVDQLFCFVERRPCIVGTLYICWEQTEEQIAMNLRQVGASWRKHPFSNREPDVNLVIEEWALGANKYSLVELQMLQKAENEGHH